jgi:hypothetical protein
MQLSHGYISAPSPHDWPARLTQARGGGERSTCRAVFYPGFFDRVLLNTELDATYATFREVVLTPAERGEPRTCQLLGESFDWQRALPGYHNLNLDTRSTDATMITLPRGVSTLRLTVDRGFYFSAVFRSLTPLVVDKAADVLSKYDQVATHEAEGAYTEHVGGTFNLWMRQTFAIKQATTLAANFHLASVDAVPYLRLALVDNDTGSSTPYMLGRLAATTLQPNEEGYTLLAYARPPMTLPAAAWALLVAADKPVGDFTTASLHETRRVEGTYAPNRHAVVTRQRVSAGAAQQLSLHVETYKECTFVVTLRKAATAESPEEETVRSWQVLRSLTLPAVKLPALPMGSEKGAPQPTYILDVRLVPEACYFTIEHNGDIPMQLDWQVAVASTVPVEVTADDTQQKEFQAIIDGWNARDPKGRADAAKAALQRMTEEAETGEVRGPSPRPRTSRTLRVADSKLPPRVRCHGCLSLSYSRTPLLSIRSHTTHVAVAGGVGQIAHRARRHGGAAAAHQAPRGAVWRGGRRGVDRGRLRGSRGGGDGGGGGRRARCGGDARGAGGGASRPPGRH